MGFFCFFLAVQKHVVSDRLVVCDKMSQTEALNGGSYFGIITMAQLVILNYLQ